MSNLTPAEEAWIHDAEIARQESLAEEEDRYLRELSRNPYEDNNAGEQYE